MLDISFYTTNGQSPETVEVTEEFYEWLAKSDFTQIGKSVPRKIQVEGEKENLSLVQLSKGNRKKLINFFHEAIIRETKAVFAQLGDSPSKKEYQEGTYRLKTLLELLEYVENETYQYLQRI